MLERLQALTGLPADKLVHLVLGTLIAAGFSVMLLVEQYAGPGWAIAAASIGMGLGVERYQAIRHEGTPDAMDWLASSSPGTLIGLCVELHRHWGDVVAFVARLG